MNIFQAIEKLKKKEIKFVKSASLNMYEQNILSIKKWLFDNNCQYFEKIIKAKDWESDKKKE